MISSPAQKYEGQIGSAVPHIYVFTIL